MALKMDVKLDNGLTVSGAYIKIEQVSVNKNCATMLVGTFIDDKNTIPIYEKFYMFDPEMSDDSKNIYAQGYAYLKTHTDFKNAIDA